MFLAAYNFRLAYGEVKISPNYKALKRLWFHSTVLNIPSVTYFQAFVLITYF